MMESFLPPHLLQDESGCNQLVGPFNTESEISHTARSSSDGRTDYDGGPPHTATAAISDPTWKPSSSHDLAAASAAKDPKRALVHALQNDLSPMLVLLERLDELLARP